MVGAFGDAKPADEETQALFSAPAVLAAVAGFLATEVAALEVVEYKTQVVAGTNFVVKAKVGAQHAIIRAFRPLPHTGAPLEVKSAAFGEDF